MLSRKEYNKLKKQHKQACEENDHSNMITMGSELYKKMKEYESEFICRHSSVSELQGGQIEKCNKCGKTWGNGIN